MSHADAGNHTWATSVRGQGPTAEQLIKHIFKESPIISRIGEFAIYLQCSAFLDYKSAVLGRLFSVQ